MLENDFVEFEGCAVTRRALQAAYDAQGAALTRKDLAGALAHTAPGFVGVGLGGHPGTFPERVRRRPRMFQCVQSLRVSAHIQKMALQGETALVQVRTRTRMTVVDPQTRRAVSEEAVFTVMDRWRETPQGWRLEHSQELAMRRYQSSL